MKTIETIMAFLSQGRVAFHDLSPKDFLRIPAKKSVFLAFFCVFE